MDLVGKKEIHRVHEKIIISLTAGNNGNFISARSVRIIAYFSWIWYNFFLLVIFYKLIFCFQKLFRGPVTWAPRTGAGPRTTTLRTTRPNILHPYLCIGLIHWWFNFLFIKPLYYKWSLWKACIRLEGIDTRSLRNIIIKSGNNELYRS